jgi:RNA polymerase sigma-70 factor, ECF subfamily
LERQQLRLSVRKAIDQLEPQHRLLIVLGELEELSYEEIRRITGLSIGTISSRLNRARQEIFRRLRVLPGVE